MNNHRLPAYNVHDTDIEIDQMQDQLRECNQLAHQNTMKTLKRIKLNSSQKHNCQIFQATESALIGSSVNMASKHQETISNQSVVVLHKRSPSNVGLHKFQNAKKTLQRKRKKETELKDVILNRKISALKELFFRKIKRNNQFSKPVHYQYQSVVSQNLFDRKGIELKENCEKIISLLYIYNIFSSIFMSTLSIAFPQVKDSLSMKILEVIGLIIFSIQIMLNFITIRFTLGRKLENIRQIAQDYFKGKFGIDFINIIVILLHIIESDPIIGYFRLFTFLKIHDCMQKLQKLEVFFIENYYNERYWSLVKVFLFNFCFAHMLAIVLMMMSKLNPNNNWLTVKRIDDAEWFQKYIWSYYWGTTIMLTIGFGDMTPVSYQEALCMVFIETISCMVLAYNINCVGSLISQIRSQDITKSKNLKIFKKLADKHEISQNLSWRINSYIQQHTNIKKLFNIQEEVQFVQTLPNAFKTDYLKQANKKIFHNLFFFRYLMQKTLFSFAQKIVMKITHPQQVILTAETNSDVFILKTGQVGYISRKANRKINKYVFDRWKVQENGSPFLLNANFITKNRSNYGIKSIIYSVLYCLDYKKFVETLQQTRLDYELFCRMRDKCKNKLDQLQVFPCQFCIGQKHTKFSCPKLHFMPIQQHVINRYLRSEKIGKNKRYKKIQRNKLSKKSALVMFLYYSDICDEKKRLQEVNSLITKKYGKQKYVIDQSKGSDNDNIIQKIEKQKQTTSFTNLSNQQLLNKFQTSLIQNTSEIIKMQFAKAFDNQKGDDIWSLDLDRMKNYKDYFAENNPCNLLHTFNVDKRIDKMMKTIVSEQQILSPKQLRSCENVSRLNKSTKLRDTYKMKQQMKQI